MSLLDRFTKSEKQGEPSENQEMFNDIVTRVMATGDPKDALEYAADQYGDGGGES